MKLDLSNSWRGIAFLIDSKKSDTGFVIVQLDNTLAQPVTKVFKSGASGEVVSWEPLNEFNGDKLEEFLTLYSNRVPRTKSKSLTTPPTPIVETVKNTSVPYSKKKKHKVQSK